MHTKLFAKLRNTTDSNLRPLRLIMVIFQDYQNPALPKSRKYQTDQTVLIIGQQSTCIEKVLYNQRSNLSKLIYFSPPTAAAARGARDQLWSSLSISWCVSIGTVPSTRREVPRGVQQRSQWNDRRANLRSVRPHRGTRFGPTISMPIAALCRVHRLCLNKCGWCARVVGFSQL